MTSETTAPTPPAIATSEVNPEEVIKRLEKLEAKLRDWWSPASTAAPNIRQAIDLIRSMEGENKRLREAPDYWPSHDLLAEIVSLQDEYDALNGGGPGWSDRWTKALDAAREEVRVEP